MLQRSKELAKREEDYAENWCAKNFLLVKLDEALLENFVFTLGVISC